MTSGSQYYCDDLGAKIEGSELSPVGVTREKFSA